MRVVRDPSWRDVDAETVLAGSPLRLLRLTRGGREVVERAATTGIAAPTATQQRFLDRLIAAGAVHPVDTRRSARPDDPVSLGLSATDVTVVMPVHGSWPSVPTGCRVIVVDDASDPPLVAPDDPARRAQVEVLRLGVNAGPAAARAAGLERVTTRLVAFVDADVEVPDGWLDDLIGHFDDPLVAAVAPRVSSRPGPTALEQYETAHSPLDLGDTPALVAAGSRVSYVPTAVLVARVDAVTECGGFDTALRFGEDVDLVWRLGAAGWRVRYEPNVVALHHPRRSWAGWFRQRVGYGSAAAPLGARHGDAVAPVRCSGWSLAVGALVLTGRRTGLAAAIAVAGTTGVLLQRRLARLPAHEAWRLVGRGHLLAGLQVARAVRRVWWPVALVGALVGGSRVRSLLALAVVAPSLVAATSSARGLRAEGRRGLVRDAALGVVDDAAYGWGVWKGVLRQRDVQALRPALSAWPQRDAG